MLIVSLLLLVGGLVQSSVSLCSPSIKCITSDSRENCEKRGLYYKENVRFNGCCPGCISLPGQNETCNPLEQCAPGLICSLQDSGEKICTTDKNSECEQKRLAAADGDWKPDCLADGTYAPKQCKGEELGDGRCFCYDPKGKRIFGEELWQKAENMTCSCSRYVQETMEVRPDVTLHCNDLGNYEPLQCDNGVCWCAEENTGIPYSKIVPEAMLQFLPCYNVDEYGNQYLRQCDSMRYSQYKLDNILKTHGINNVYINSASCNYDGSYSRVQIIKGKKFCAGKDGKSLNEYTFEVAENMNCNCEYDHSIIGDSFIYQCAQNGNYQEKQHDGENIFCVDEDGINMKCK